MGPSAQTPESTVTAFIELVNRRDKTGFIEAFAIDGYVDDWGRVFRGRAAIAAWSQREFIGSNGVFTVSASTSTGSLVSVVGDWRSNHANGLSTFTFVVLEGKIASMTIREG